MFVHVRANDWVELKVRPTPVCARCSNCFNVYDVCACVCMNRSKVRQPQAKSKTERTINVVRTHTHTLAYVADTLTHSHQCELTSLDCFWWCARCSLVVWLYSPARNDRNVLKWDNCCFDWLHYYCCCLIFFLFAFLLFAKNHLCLYVDFFVVYIYFFLLLLIIFFVHFYISCIYGMYLCVCGYISFLLAHTHTQFCIIWSTQSSSTRIIVNF